MNTVRFENGEFSVDAATIAAGLQLHPTQVQARMRQGKITSLCERGIDEDAGRYRLTFFYSRRRFQLLVDEAGTILERVVDDRRHRQRR